MIISIDKQLFWKCTGVLFDKSCDKQNKIEPLLGLKIF